MENSKKRKTCSDEEKEEVNEETASKKEQTCPSSSSSPPAPSLLSPKQENSVLETLKTHLLNDKKFLKAAKLLIRYIDSIFSDHKNNDISEEIFQTIELLLCECATRDVTDKEFREGYVSLFECVVDRHLHEFPTEQQYRLQSFHVYANIRNQLKSDDQFVYAKVCKTLQSMIESLDYSDKFRVEADAAEPNEEASSNNNNSNNNSEEPLTDSPEEQQQRQEVSIRENTSRVPRMERQRVLLSALEMAFRSFHWNWAKQPCSSLFRSVSERRLHFDDLLREQLDELTELWTVAQRKHASWSGPHSIRKFNSTAHPLLTRKNDLIR